MRAAPLSPVVGQSDFARLGLLTTTTGARDSEEALGREEEEDLFVFNDT